MKAEKHKRKEINVGPGSYNITSNFKNIEEEDEFIKKAAFNSSAPRFKSHSKAKTIENSIDIRNKPVYEL